MPGLKHSKSSLAFAQAKKFFPGGVNSPVRAYGGVGGEPLFIKRGKGPHIWDIDGNRFIDYVGSWGPAILGHAHQEVIDAIKEQLGNGLSFGAPTELESRLAESVVAIHPHMKKMRFVSSGTEACMAALRVARGATGRNKILKFEGCYHGHADCLLVKAGSGAATFGIPGSAGVPPGTAQDTLTAEFNNVAAVEQIFSEYGDQIAAVIVEPVVGNAGFIRPAAGFLQFLRTMTHKHHSLLIFDEVMTGLRVRLGGVQELTGITPDITTLGKIVGGGLPLAVYGGTEEIMNKIAPLGPIYQAGTLSGNPIAVTAGIKTLEILRRDCNYLKLNDYSRELCRRMTVSAEASKIPFNCDSEGGMFGFFFSGHKITNFAEAKGSDLERFKKFFWLMLERGIYLAPSAYEANFCSFTHGAAELDATMTAFDQAIGELARGA
jgi:glutamate-1-semialdehyde 2,1-aminomutase